MTERDPQAGDWYATNLGPEHPNFRLTWKTVESEDDEVEWRLEAESMGTGDLHYFIPVEKLLTELEGRRIYSKENDD